ncbi:MAG: Xaa-Pro peptidase family protein [Terriglobia bacterium]
MLFNQNRAIQFMKECQLDVLVATSPVNITYFTDFYYWLDSAFKEYMTNPGSSSHRSQSYAVFPVTGRPALILGAQSAVNAADLWVGDLHVYGAPGFDESFPLNPQTSFDLRFADLLRDTPKHPNATEALRNVLSERGLEQCRIGLEMEALPPATQEAIRRALPRASIKDATNLIRLVRAVKSTPEINRLVRCAEINEQAAMESLTLARPGKSMTDLIQHFRLRSAELGADFEHFAFSLNGMGIGTETKHLLTSNDILFVDFGCIYAHYFSDTGTTLVLGNFSRNLKEKYQALVTCIELGAELMRPGIKSSAIQSVMREHLKQHGIIASFPHGHGLGLEIRDYPIIVPENGLRIRDECVDVPSDLPIEEGMVNNLEACVFMPTVGALHVERSYLVTAQGSRPLLSQDRSQPRGPGHPFVG